VAADVTVLLEHLVSYQGMGRVLVECQAGCTCMPQVIDGHYVDPIRNTSVFVETSLAVCAVASQLCQLQITVLNDSSSGLHKFKLRSLRVKATAGNTSGTLGSAAARAVAARAARVAAAKVVARVAVA
jgi:hypothetical protein